MRIVLGLTAAAVLTTLLSSAVSHAASDRSDLYPIVGAPVGTPYPAEYTEIARDPNDIPAEPAPDGATITITADEVRAFIAPKNNADAWEGGGNDEGFVYFAFGGGQTDVQEPLVPGPFIRLLEGNTATIRLVNLGDITHSIDFHAVVGEKGGASTLLIPGGEEVEFTFKAEDPGLYVYHCVGAGTPYGIAHHMNNGMVGLILVEPRPGSDPNNKFLNIIENATEHYVMQFDVYQTKRVAASRILTKTRCWHLRAHRLPFITAA